MAPSSHTASYRKTTKKMYHMLRHLFFLLLLWITVDGPSVFSAPSGSKKAALRPIDGEWRATQRGSSEETRENEWEVVKKSKSNKGKKRALFGREPSYSKHFAGPHHANEYNPMILKRKQPVPPSLASAVKSAPPQTSALKASTAKPAAPKSKKAATPSFHLIAPKDEDDEEKAKEEKTVANPSRALFLRALSSGTSPFRPGSPVSSAEAPSTRFASPLSLADSWLDTPSFDTAEEQIDDADESGEEEGVPDWWTYPLDGPANQENMDPNGFFAPGSYASTAPTALTCSPPKALSIDTALPVRTDTTPFQFSAPSIFLPSIPHSYAASAIDEEEEREEDQKTEKQEDGFVAYSPRPLAAFHLDRSLFPSSHRQSAPSDSMWAKEWHFLPVDRPSTTQRQEAVENDTLSELTASFAALGQNKKSAKRDVFADLTSDDDVHNTIVGTVVGNVLGFNDEDDIDSDRLLERYHTNTLARPATPLVAEHELERSVSEGARPRNAEQAKEEDDEGIFHLPTDLFAPASTENKTLRLSPKTDPLSIALAPSPFERKSPSTPAAEKRPLSRPTLLGSLSTSAVPQVASKLSPSAQPFVVRTPSQEAPPQFPLSSSQRSGHPMPRPVVPPHNRPYVFGSQHVQPPAFTYGSSAPYFYARSPAFYSGPPPSFHHGPAYPQGAPNTVHHYTAHYQ